MELRQTLFRTSTTFVPRELKFHFKIRISPEFGRETSTNSESGNLKSGKGVGHRWGKGATHNLNIEHDHIIENLKPYKEQRQRPI